jgi:hypothetical protein
MAGSASDWVHPSPDIFTLTRRYLSLLWHESPKRARIVLEDGRRQAHGTGDLSGHYTMAIFVSPSVRATFRALLFSFCVATHSPACIKVFVQCTNYNFVTKILRKHPLNPPQFDRKVHPISLLVKIQSLMMTDSPTLDPIISHFHTTSVLSLLIKIVPLT